MVLQAGKSKIKAPADPVSDESLLPDLHTPPISPDPHMVQERREASPLTSLHTRVLVPSPEQCSQSTSQRPHPQIPHWRLGFPCVNFQGHNYLVYTTCLKLFSQGITSYDIKFKKDKWN